MLRLMLLTTAAAFALVSSVASAEDKPPPKARRQASGERRQQVTGERPRSKPPPKARTYRAAAQLPPGLPRAGYRYRTTIAPAAPYHRAPLPETDEALLITPAYGPERLHREPAGHAAAAGRHDASPAITAGRSPMIIRARITAARTKAITGACPTPAAFTATASSGTGSQPSCFATRSARSAAATAAPSAAPPASARRWRRPDATAQGRSAPD